MTDVLKGLLESLPILMLDRPKLVYLSEGRNALRDLFTGRIPCANIDVESNVSTAEKPDALFADDHDSSVGLFLYLLPPAQFPRLL